MSDGVGSSSQNMGNTKVVEIGPEAPALREHVREVIASPAFKGSRRSQQFLQHIVEKTISGHADEVKERSLGVDLFARLPAYDTGEDAIVRVTASDVRKRLHQFYSETQSEIRIELPSGSYVPEFRRIAARAPEPPVPAIDPAPFVTPPPPPPAARQTALGFRRPALYMMVGLGISSISWLLFRESPASPLVAKNVLPWSTILGSDRQIQVILSDPDLAVAQELLGFRISLSDYANRKFAPEAPSHDVIAQRAVRLLRGADVASVDVGIVLNIARLAAARLPQVTTRPARSLQLRDFQTDDDFVVLGSPRSNPWGGLYNDLVDFDFIYDEGLKQEVIRNKHAQKGELPLYVPTAKGWDTGQAYAIVAFTQNPGQRGHVLLLAGTNAEGTEAAGKFATDVELLSSTLRKYGIDPNGGLRHFEVLLEVRTMAGSPSALAVIACHALQP
jgi:hypothetical protein